MGVTSRVEKNRRAQRFKTLVQVHLRTMSGQILVEEHRVLEGSTSFLVSTMSRFAGLLVILSTVFDCFLLY